MPLDLKVFRIGEFLRTTPKGDFDLERSKEMIASIAEAAADAGEVDILIDIRELHSVMTVVDIYELAAELGNYRDAFKNKVAVLDMLDDKFDQAEFFETCARNWGFQVRAFTDFEAAIDWMHPPSG